MTTFYANTIPAGIADDNVEFFTSSGEVLFFRDGTVHKFEEISIGDLESINALIKSDKKASECLDQMGLKNEIDRARQFAFCRFGGLDSIADLECGNPSFEYWNCGRKPCPHEGKLCKFPETKTGKLTRHEAKIIKHIGNELLNKQIADDLNISIETVNKECKRIAEKIGCYGKQGIAAFAAMHNMI